MKRSGILLLLVSLAPVVSAQPAPEARPADLGALLREAEAGSPALLASAARRAAAGHIHSQVETLPDPEVAVSYTNDGVSQFTLGDRIMSNLALSWRQEAPYPGKLGLRGEMAAAEADAAGREFERSRLEIAAAVKSDYAELYRLDRTMDFLEETRLVLVSLAEAARRRYEVGEGIQESVLKAQTEILRLEAEQARVEQERRAAAVRLIDLPEVAPPGDPEELAQAAVLASPGVAMLDAVLRRDEAGARLARLELKPDFLWSASYMNRDGLDPMVMAMFGLRLPLHRGRKQAQGVLQSDARLLAARHELAAMQVRTRADVRDIVSRFARADRLATLFAQGVIPQAQSALESAQASYGVGRVAILDLLGDLRTLLGARIDLASQKADRVQALAALEPLLARELIPVPRTSAPEGGHDASDR
jgi:cobalt-zinc-cadmium efflux system outer membrane protein